MSIKTLTGNYAGYVLSQVYTGLSITATGTVTGDPGGRFMIGGTGVTVPFAAPVTNDGVISGGPGGFTEPDGAPPSGGTGVELEAGGALVNTGTIKGGDGGVSGSHIIGLQGVGVVLLAGGAVLNKAGGVVEGYHGVYVSGAGTVTNFGTIAATGGTALLFSSASDRLIAEAGSTFVGAVAGGGGTLELASGTGTITGLGATGTISGGKAMTFSGFGSYQLDAGSSWTLSGASSVAGGGTLTSMGTMVVSGAVGGTGTLAINGGTATIATGATVTVANLAMSGGTTSLNESLLYKGAFTMGAGATLALGGRDGLNLSGASSLRGLINGAATVAMANATVSGLTLGGGAVLRLTGKATQIGAITVGDATSKALLSIAAGATWTINGAVGMVHGAAAGSSLQVVGAMIKSGATGTSAINLITSDTGTIEVAAGTLDFASKLTGTGVLKIDAGATLQVDSTAASTLHATFNGAGGALALSSPTTFAATIAGFAVGDAIDLLGKQATGASINGSDQLVIVNGATTVASLQLIGAYNGATFTIGSDGHGGTNVTLLTAAAVPTPPATSPHALVAAMASLGAISASAPAASSPIDLARPTLLVPRGR